MFANSGVMVRYKPLDVDGTLFTGVSPFEAFLIFHCLEEQRRCHYLLGLAMRKTFISFFYNFSLTLFQLIEFFLYIFGLMCLSTNIKKKKVIVNFAIYSYKEISNLFILLLPLIWHVIVLFGYKCVPAYLVYVSRKM